MATAQVTITTALQALKVLGLGQSPTTAQNEYCLRQLNSYIRQLVGFGGSLPYATKRLDGSFELPTSWPAARLLCMGGYTVTLPKGDGSEPVADGSRVQVIDAAETAATSNITIARNGWLINGSASNYTISTNGGSVLLMFRADLGDWTVAADLALADNLPFPTDFDEAIALILAERLSLFGQTLSPKDQELAAEGARRLRSRYTKPPPAHFDSAVSGISGERSRVGVVGSYNDFLNGVS